MERGQDEVMVGSNQAGIDKVLQEQGMDKNWIFNSVEKALKVTKKVQSNLKAL